MLTIKKGKNYYSAQIDFFQNLVDNRSIKVEGKQYTKSNDRFTILITIKSGLPYISLRPYTNSEQEVLAYIILTSDVDQDPSVLDCNAEDNEEWFDA